MSEYVHQILLGIPDEQRFHFKHRRNLNQFVYYKQHIISECKAHDSISRQE